MYRTTADISCLCPDLGVRKGAILNGLALWEGGEWYLSSEGVGGAIVGSDSIYLWWGSCGVDDMLEWWAAATVAAIWAVKLLLGRDAPSLCMTIFNGPDFLSAARYVRIKYVSVTAALSLMTNYLK